jgi:protein-S-isoprenylcysteine O-methyltransferase Ste14
MKRHRSWQYTAIQEAITITVVVAFILAFIVGVGMLQNIASLAHSVFGILALLIVVFGLLSMVYAIVLIIGRRRP